MKRSYFACLFLCLATTFSLSQSNPLPVIGQKARVAVPTNAPHADPQAQARILNNYGKLPLGFEANHGQSDPRVKFLSRTGGYTLFLTGDEAVLALSGKKASPNNARIVDAAHTMKPDHAAPESGGVLHMKLRNANPSAKITGVDELLGTSNYFIGNDPTKWQTNVPIYAKVKYEGIYKGVDLVYYGNQRQLEYDFIVAPGVDPHHISFDVRGAKRVHRDRNGDLVFKMGEDGIRWHKPLVYQEEDGARREIAAHYAVTDTNRVGFELAKYDVSRPLYIDPLIYSTYLGGSGLGQGAGITVDSSGNAYITGITQSYNFPITPGAFQTACGNPTACANAFVSKLNTGGSALVYSTYLGGSSTDSGQGIAVDNSGNVYVTGGTTSTDFPVTPGAFQTTCGNSSSCTNAFVTKLNPTGSGLLYSTYLGGNGASGYGIALDGANNTYITGGTSSNFPTTPGAFQTTYGGGNGAGDAFVTKLNPTGASVVYSTYLGGSNYDVGSSIAVDSSGNAYIIGTTQSYDFPVTPAAFQTVCRSAGSCFTAFVTKLDANGSVLAYSTYLGGNSFEQGGGIAVDSFGNAYVTGDTYSANFPITPGAFQTACGGGCYDSDAFVTKFNPTGAGLVYSTYLGGTSFDAGIGIAVDSSGDAYVTGNTFSANFPVTPGALQTTFGGGSDDGFATKLNPSGSALVYSTYLGGISFDLGLGIAADGSGNAYVTGGTSSTNFPTMNPFQPNYGGGSGTAFVAKISPEPSEVAFFPLHLDFGYLPIGVGSSPQLSTLTNVSDVTLDITSFSVIGADSGDFIQANNCAASLLPGTSCSITVAFTPTAKGNRTAAVNIVDGAPDSPQSLSLSGVGALDTVTQLVSSKNPSLLHKPVTFKVAVSSPSGGTPTGSLLFSTGQRL